MASFGNTTYRKAQLLCFHPCFCSPSPCFVPPTNRSQTARPYPSRPLFPEVDRIEIDILETESYNEQHPCVHHQTSCTSSQNRSGTRTMTSGSIDSSSPLQGGCWSRSIRPVSEVDSVPSDLQQLIVSSRSLQNLPCPEIVSSPKTKETQRRMDYYNTLISPLLDETMERQWRIPVMKSTTGKEKRRKESAKRLHKIYTSGMHRVITLKTAENVAMVSAPSSSSLSSGSNRISAEDMMYLERVLGSSERARELIQVSTERSSHLLDQILETS